MREAALIDARGMRLDDLPEGDEVGELIDVKPKDMAAIEHGAINLGPIEEWKRAQGQRWRFFIELSYSAAAGQRARRHPDALLHRRRRPQLTAAPGAGRRRRPSRALPRPD